MVLFISGFVFGVHPNLQVSTWEKSILHTICETDGLPDYCCGGGESATATPMTWMWSPDESALGMFATKPLFFRVEKCVAPRKDKSSAYTLSMKPYVTDSYNFFALMDYSDPNSTWLHAVDDRRPLVLKLNTCSIAAAKTYHGRWCCLCFQQATSFAELWRNSHAFNALRRSTIFLFRQDTDTLQAELGCLGVFH